MPHWLNGVFTFPLTHFLVKTIFSRGYVGVKNSSGNSGGVGRLFSGKKMEIPGRRGAYMKFPPWWDFKEFHALHFSQFLLLYCYLVS